MDKEYDEMDFNDLFDVLKDDVKVDSQIKEKINKVSSIKGTVNPSRTSQVGSQKAKSFLNYVDLCKSGLGKYKIPNTELILLQDNYDIVLSAFERLDEEKGFLRACPENPRHGVLESIEVSMGNLEERWNYLRGVMLEEDPNGCMLLQPFIPATSSMVAVPNVYAWIGRDHDGITAGKDGVKMCYLFNPNEKSCTKHFETIRHAPNTYELEYVYQKDDNYLTEMYGHGTSHLTQIRGSEPHTVRGPPFVYNRLIDGKTVETLSKEMGAVPNGVGKIDVKDVWRTEGLEELAWLEANITKDKMPEGFVISHPNGSLGSHVYAHCRSHGIPYIVAEVSVGDVWVEGSPTHVAKEEGLPIDPNPYNPYLPDDIAAFADGLERNRTQWRRQQGWFAHYFHQWLSGFNMNPKHNAHLSGAFCGWLVKSAVGLCFGELRHAFGMKTDMSIEFTPAIVAAIGSSKFVELHDKVSPSKDRKHYYLALEGYELTYEEMEKALRWCGKQFQTGWPQKNFGGKKWAECAFGVANLASAIIKFNKDKNESNIQKVTTLANIVESYAHNTGNLYNKFLEKTAFDYGTLNESDSVIGWFAHGQKDLNRMFKTYEVTRTFLEETFTTTRPENDWYELFDYLLKKSTMSYKHTPICSNQVHKPLQVTANLLGPKWLHHDTKYTLNDDYFIPCGHDDCTVCDEKDIITVSLGMDSQLTSMLLADEAPSIFFALEHNKSKLITYRVAQMIKQKEYDDVDTKMFVEAWNGLDREDPMYKVLARMLKKQLKKKIATDEDWTNEVTTTIAGGDLE